MAQFNTSQQKQITANSNDDLYIKIPLLIIGILLGGNLLIFKLLLNHDLFCGLTTGIGIGPDLSLLFYFIQFLGCLIIVFALHYTNFMNAKKIIPQLLKVIIIAILIFIPLIYVYAIYIGFGYCWVF